MGGAVHVLQHGLVPLSDPPQGPGWNRAWMEAAGYSAARLRPAAVLVGVRDDTHKSLILTRRQDSLTAHAGQVAFPGGARDAGDTDMVHTALREAYEEVGLPPDCVTPLGYLDCFETVSDYLVTPVVARVAADAPPLRANAGEVAAVFEVPLDFFMDRHNLLPCTLTRHGVARRMVEFHYAGFRIWGATAAMLMNFLQRTGQTWASQYL